MATKTKVCKHCNETIAKNAKTCPKCGGKFGVPGFVKFLVIIGIIIGCLVGCINSCTKAVDDAIEETKDSYNDKNGKTKFKLNESFENKYEKITMVEVNDNFKDYNEYLGPAKGNKIILVKFEVENIGDRDEVYVSSLSFNGYADGVAVKQFLYTGDNYKDLSATLSKGKKTVGYIAYEVPSKVENFTIEYNADFWSDGTSIEFMVK